MEKMQEETKSIAVVRNDISQTIVSLHQTQAQKKKKKIWSGGMCGWRNWRGQVDSFEGHSGQSGGAAIWAITGAVGEEFAILSARIEKAGRDVSCQGTLPAIWWAEEERKQTGRNTPVKFKIQPKKLSES